MAERVTTEFTHRLRVRYADCDPQGVVFNGNYLTYLDEAMVALLRATADGYGTVTDRGLDYVVAETGLRFLAPARPEEELAIGVEITRLGTTGMSTRHAIVRIADRPPTTVAEATMRFVWIEMATGAKTPIPGWLREALAPHVVADA